MKQIFKATMLLCLAVAVIITTAACGPQAPAQQTTPEVTTPEVTTPEVTTPTEPETPDDPYQPEGSVLVDSINGKTTAELLVQFTEDYSNAQSIHIISSTMIDTDSFQYEDESSIKIHNGEFEVVTVSDGVTTAVYFVNNTIYLNEDGSKIKISDVTVEEILGDDYMDDLLDGGIEIDEDMLENAEAANIYLANGIYTVTFSSYDEGSEEDVVTTFSFNEEGKLTKLSAVSESAEFLIEFHSYGEAVEILPPADAEEYVEMSQTPSLLPTEIPTTPEEIYAAYVAICEIFGIVTRCQFDYEDPDTSAEFRLYDGDYYAYVYGEDTDYELWMVDGKGYYTTDFENYLTMDSTDELMNFMASILSSIPTYAIAEEDIADLTCSYDPDWDEVTIGFVHTTEAGEALRYEYTYTPGGNGLGILVTTADDANELVVEFDFFFSNDIPQITAPVQ